MPETPTSQPGSHRSSPQVARKTVIALEIEHYKELPADTAALIAQRAYGLLYSKGVEVGMKATVLEQKESL
jgi:hypothetical protein